MKEEQIVVCDLWAKQLEHYEFNKNIIEIILKMDKEVLYFGDKEQIEYFKTDNIVGKIDYSEIEINKKNKISVIWNNIKNLLLIKKNKKEKIVILNSSPIIIFFAKIFFNVEIYFFIHGLDILLKEKKRTYAFFPKLLKFFNNDKYKYLVLGEVIKKNLEKLNPDIKNIFSIDHPYTFTLDVEEKKIGNRIIVGTCGITNNEKGLDNIFDFIDIKKEIIDYKHIGKCLNNVPINYLDYFPYRSKMLDKEKFQSLILELDYILILYPHDSYKLTASGIYFDCIKYNKPLLGLTNDYLSYMFEKYGEIGKLYDTVEEINKYLSQDKKILEKEAKKYFNNMKKIRESLNRRVYEELKSILK